LSFIDPSRIEAPNTSSFTEQRFSVAIATSFVLSARFRDDLARP
jgi:hypothetical protein